MFNTTIDCANQSSLTDLPAIADISGLGVLIGFISTSYILFVVVIVYYLFSFNPTLDPFRKSGDRSTRCTRPNPFDWIFLKSARALFRIRAPELRSHHTHSRLETVFQRCILSMADVQLVTGVSILIGGYASLSSGLSVLHWEMILFLAWFSCLTHQMALSFLRNYLINHPAQRMWRLIAMFLLLAALTTGLVPTSRSKVEDTPAHYAICYFYRETAGNAGSPEIINMLVTVMLLVFGYIIKVCRLYKIFAGLSIESLSTTAVMVVVKSATYFQKLFGTSTLADRIVANMLVSAHIIVCLWLDMLTSMASDVYWLIVSLAWGTKKILQLRSIESSLKLGNDAELNTWTFGQIIPVLLIASPLVTLVEHCLDSEDDHHPEYSEPNSENTEIESGQQDTEEYKDATIITSELLPTNTQPPVKWILYPDRLDEYYHTSVWMFSTPFIPLFGVGLGTAWLLWNNATSMIFIAFVLSIFVVQGVLLQYHILILSALECRWKGWKMNIMACVYVALGATVLARSFGNWEPYTAAKLKNYIPWGYLMAASAGVFVVALVARKAFSLTAG